MSNQHQVAQALNDLEQAFRAQDCLNTLICAAQDEGVLPPADALAELQTAAADRVRRQFNRVRACFPSA